MTTKGSALADKLAIVPILESRSWYGWWIWFSSYKSWLVGVYRNEETLEPVYYYCKLPEDIRQKKL